MTGVIRQDSSPTHWAETPCHSANFLGETSQRLGRHRKFLCERFEVFREL